MTPPAGPPSDAALNPEIRELLARAEAEFPAESPRERRLEAELLLSHVLRVERLDLYISNPAIPPERLERIIDLFARRAAHEPLQHLTGEAGFRDLILSVGPGALVPRPETELLVGLALEKVFPGAKLVDVGTGTGAIALAVASESEGVEVFAVDLSADALALAAANRGRLRLDEVLLLQGDLLEAFADACMDVVVSNPPYIADSERYFLPEDVRNFEPSLALFSGPDGLDAIRRLVSGAARVLKPGGWLLFEIGSSQGAAARDLLERSGAFAEIAVLPDLNGLDRMVRAKRKEGVWG